MWFKTAPWDEALLVTEQQTKSNIMQQSIYGAVNFLRACVFCRFVCHHGESAVWPNWSVSINRFFFSRNRRGKLALWIRGIVIPLSFLWCTDIRSGRRFVLCLASAKLIDCFAFFFFYFPSGSGFTSAPCYNRCPTGLATRGSATRKTSASSRKRPTFTPWRRPWGRRRERDRPKPLTPPVCSERRAQTPWIYLMISVKSYR